MRSRHTRLLLVLAVLTSVFALLPATPAVPAGHGAKVTVVHGVPGLTVDICVDGAEAIEDFEFGDIAAELPFVAGTYDLGVTAADAGCGAAILTANNVPLADGDNVSVVAHLDAGGSAVLTIFNNDTTGVDLGYGRLTVRHTAEAPAVDIWADGVKLFENLSNPNEDLDDVRTGTYEVAIQANPSADADDPAVGPTELDVLGGNNRIVYAVGTLGSTFDLLVQDISVETINPSVITPIYDIQGSTPSGDADSPLEGDPVRTAGVVTADFQHNGGLGGFFIQDPVGDADPDTSDGIFVDAVSPFNASVGAMVEVVGFVEENFGQTQITDVVELNIVGPVPVPAATPVSPPFNDGALEKYEGMLVSFADTLAVTDTFNLHRFGEVWLTKGGVSVQPTNVFGGGTGDMFDLADQNMENSVLLDDGSTGSNPDPVPYLMGPAPGTLRLGDWTDDLVGAVGYGFGQYRIQPTTVSFNVGNPRPAVPDVGGEVKVASFNVLNYFTTLDERGAETNAQLAVQTDKLVDAIWALGADVVALQEIENDPAHTPITTLVAALNAEVIGSPWSWIGEVDHYNTYPIRNEIIYRNDRVIAVGDPVTVAHPAFDSIPPGRDTPLGRPPVAQTFMYGPETFTVMSNHFKSKGCSGATDGDTDQGDGQSCFNATRVAQAGVVLDLVDTLVTDSGDPDVLVVGDLNAYMEEDPILELETELENLLEIHDPDAYSFNFFATFAFPFVGRGALDHAFATWEQHLKVTGAATWHINADEPRVLDWFDTSIVAPDGYRSSDHDPVLIGLSMPNDFQDIGNSVFTEDILFISAMSITFGCNPPLNTLFCPTRQLSKGELAALVVRALNLPASAVDAFDDDDDSVFEDDINALAAAGAAVECAADMYCPDQLVPRDVTAATLAKAFGLPATGTDYFTDDEASPFEDYINRLREAGITFGCNPPANTLFCPNLTLDRGMIAAFIHRAARLGLIPPIA